MSELLRVEDLWVRFATRTGATVEAVRGISFSVGRERVGIVGESGSGKSMTGRAISFNWPYVAALTRMVSLHLGHCLPVGSFHSAYLQSGYLLQAKKIRPRLLLR